MVRVETGAREGWREFARWKGIESPRSFVPCNAPATTMSFQVDGRVFACCRKPHSVLGDVNKQSLTEIWNGEPARMLRATMNAGTFPAACAPCALFALSGSPSSADLRKYEHLVADEHASMPRRMEFNLANTCNLACVHCCGTLSSRIRASRERLPPIPRVYGESFFEQLREFLPHLDECVFLGGEPFLQVECHRIWDDLLQLERRPRLNIVTNGTLLDERAERALSAMEFCLNVSVDGATRTTVEAVRVGAEFATIARNLERFAELADRPRCELNLAFCPMPLNLHELPDVCAWAARLGAGVKLNFLTDPSHLSIFHMSAAALEEALQHLRRRLASSAEEMGANARVLEGFIETVGRHAARTDSVAVKDALLVSRRAAGRLRSPGPK